MARVGVPRTLTYFIYYPLWKSFFETLGHNVILSPPTSKSIMDKGIRDAVNDACIPIKVYHGHIAYLADKVDYIFCPRFVSVRKFGDFGTETFCPKFLGLPDMVRYCIQGLPKIIDTRIDLKLGKNELLNVFLNIGGILGHTAEEIKVAMKKAQSIQQKFLKTLASGVLPPVAIDYLVGKIKELPQAKPTEFCIAVIGYPYILYDPYINAGLLKLLEKEKVKVVTQDMLMDKEMNRQSRTLPKDLFWYFSNRAVFGALHYLNNPAIDGIIHVTAFACGPDSMVDRLIEIETKRRSSLPFLSITVDEHTGEAGVRTRVEAFLDMLRYRRSDQ